MNYLLRTAAWLLILAVFTLSGGCDRRSDIIHLGENAAISITCRFVSTGLPISDELRYGTGFFVSDKLVVTAFHVVKSLTRDAENFEDGKVGYFVEKYDSNGKLIYSFRASVLQTSEENDLALLNVESDLPQDQRLAVSVQPLKISDVPIQQGDSVAIIGYFGTEVEPYVSIGTVSLISNFENRRDKELPLETIYVNSVSLPGNSGGPIIALDTGKVVGVQLGVMNWSKTPSSMSYGAYYSNLQKLIDTYAKSQNSTK